MREKLEKELEKIGLSEKEAKVYLGALELGPSTAQSIAAKATVNRPTTYIMIESLIKRGLMSSFEKGKKRYFSAGDPHQFLYIIENQKREIRDREDSIKKIISEISNLPKTNIRPAIRIYENMSGIGAMQEDMLSTDADTLYEVTSLDIVRKFIPPIGAEDVRLKILKKFKIKSLYYSSVGLIEKQYEKQKNLETKRISTGEFPIKGEVIICGNKVCFSSFNNGPIYTLIEDEEISTTVRSMFLAFWKIAE